MKIQNFFIKNILKKKIINHNKLKIIIKFVPRNFKTTKKQKNEN